MLGARQRPVRGSARPLQLAYVSGCLADTWRIGCYSRGTAIQGTRQTYKRLITGAGPWQSPVEAEVAGAGLGKEPLEDRFGNFKQSSSHLVHVEHVGGRLLCRDDGGVVRRTLIQGERDQAYSVDAA